MPPAPLSSAAFADAVLRVAGARDRPVVVKLGGSAMEDPAATDACLRSVAALNRLGVPIVLVHGGGKPIDRAMAAAGLTPRKVAGRRYTDDATMEIVARVLVGEINQQLVLRFRELGGRATITGILLHGERLELRDEGGRPVDMGRVGAVTRVDPGIGTTVAEGVVPFVPSVAHDAAGGWLNVNADTAAAAVAGALKASRVIFLTDTPGVLRDRAVPESLFRKLTERECRDLIAAGVIDGGMVPKVEACFEALEAGASAALILDGRVLYSLIDVFLNDTFTGTEITR